MSNRKILSWDVGIKHLAFSIISETPTGFTIDKLENIDLTDSDILKCCGLLKKKNKNAKEEICGAHAKFFCGIKYYCGTHKSQYIVDSDAVEKQYVTICNNENKSSSSGLVSELCEYKSNKKGTKCVKKVTFIFDGIKCCKSHKDIQFKSKIKELTLKPLKIKNCMDTPPQVICEKMYKKLNDLECIRSVTDVYIENQPELNNTMRGVSSMLLAYFVFLSQSSNLTMTIQFVSAAIKIKLDADMIKYTIEYIDEHKKINVRAQKNDCKCRICKLDIELKRNKEEFQENYLKYKFNYDSTKELGIIYTQKILKDNNMNDILNLINSHNKKDDLCDAFLHGYKKLKS